MQPAPGMKEQKCRRRKKCLFTPKNRLDMRVKCRTHSFWRRGSLTQWCQGTHWCLCRGRIPVPGALNQAFNIIDLITLSILLLSLQLLMFSCCWKGQTQPQISLKVTHLKQQDDTSESSNYFVQGVSESAQQRFLKALTSHCERPLGHFPQGHLSADMPSPSLTLQTAHPGLSCS